MSFKKKPPLGAPLNPYHPLSRGMVGCWLMNDRGGTFAFDSSVNRRILDTFDAGATWKSEGINFNNGGITNADIFSPISENSCTIIFYAKPGNMTSDQYVSTGSSGAQAVADSRNLRSILLGFQNNYWNIYNRVYPTGTAADTQILASAGVYQTVAYTCNGSVLCGYLDGTKMVNVAANLDLHPSYPIDRFYLGRSRGGSYSVNLDMQWFFYYNRALTEYEIASLYANPYQMFEPQPIGAFEYVAAGGGFQPAWARNSNVILQPGYL